MRPFFVLCAALCLLGCSTGRSLEGHWVVENSRQPRSHDWLRFMPGEKLEAHFHLPDPQNPEINALLIEIKGRYTLVDDKITMYAEEMKLGAAGDVPGIDPRLQKLGEEFKLSFNAIGAKRIEWEGANQMRIQLPTGETWVMRRT